MSVEIFTREQFEQALPVSNKTGALLWAHAGFDTGEHTYNVRPFPSHPTLSAYALHVRSSVNGSGVSAGTGEDSIRAWIVRDDGKHAAKSGASAAGTPFGSKVSRYVTRVPGWQDRLTDTLRRLTQIMRQIQPCDTCGAPCPIFKAGKQCKNAGKLFAKCVNRECTRPRFAWFTE